MQVVKKLQLSHLSLLDMIVSDFEAAGAPIRGRYAGRRMLC